MSKKEARTELILAYKATVKQCNTYLDIYSDNLRILTRNKDDLGDA